MTKYFALLLLSLAGCASTRSWQVRDIPPRAQVENVPFIAQAAGYCGPATMAMTMAWAGQPAPVEAIASEVLTPDTKGTLPQDMITAARRHGLMAVKIEGFPALLHEVAAGHPVIIFENLAFAWLPRWHYAIVTGYDIERRELTMISGPNPHKHWKFRTFDKSWEYSKRWGLVVLPAGQLAESHEELAQVAAAAGLESAGKTFEAELSYNAILKRWPQSLGALIGLGNVAFKREDYESAVDYLRSAVENHPDSLVARHNLKVALLKL